MKILLFRGKGVMPWLIRLQTRSRWSHVAIVVNGTLYEAWQFAGVRKMPYAEHEKKHGTAGIDIFKLNVPCDVAAVQAYLESRVGKGYDWVGVLRFVTRRRVLKNDRDFCSELGFAGIQAGGVSLFARTEPWEVSPGWFGRSTLLSPA